jgi:hypothetical protein
MIDGNTMFIIVLPVALLLLQIPWMLRYTRGIATLVGAIQAASQRRQPHPHARKQQERAQSF